MGPSSPPEGIRPRADGTAEGTAEGTADLAAAALLTGLGLALLHGSLGPDRVPGAALGEAWGRLFVTAQVGRWVRGEAPWGRADLLAWPGGQPFWPTDPLLQALAVPLSALLGDTAALVALTALLLALAGVGAQVLARALGARPLGGLLAGAMVQLSPFLLRHTQDTVLEVLAIGPLALALAAALRWTRGQGPATPLLLLALAGVAGTSPTSMVYLALACTPGLLLPARPGRRLLGLALAGALVSALFLAPLQAAEGAGGRLSAAWVEGYDLAPPLRVREDGSPQRDRAPTPLARDLDPVEAAVRRVPGGLALLLAALLGLTHRPARRPALLALLFLVLGPEPWAALGSGGPTMPGWGGPLASAFARLPLLDHLGNPGRVGALVTLFAASTAGVLVAARRALALPLAAVLALEARVLGAADLPATPVEVPAGLLERLEGPFVVFPSGEPPTWHARVRPKEALFLAGRAGRPQAGDYGRGGLPADLPVQVRLAREAGAALAGPAWTLAPPLPDTAEAWGALPFTSLLVLDARLDLDEQRRLRTWLGAHAELRARNGGWSLWAWPDRFPAP